jgi:serine/threonine protein kinase
MDATSRLGDDLDVSDDASQNPSPTDRIGRYLLDESIGVGGMGEVYKSRFFAAAGLVKDLCVKRIRAERLSRPGAVERFIEEARLSMSLNHANVVAVFDFGRTGDEHYLAMEWVDGADLKVILEQARQDDDPLSSEVVAHVGAEVARALAYAHGLDTTLGRSVVHQDVKPANILISRAGDVKLSDFGVATLTGLDADRPAGTRRYMAPERLRGEAAHPRIDIYSLGVVLAEMLGIDPCESCEEALEGLEPPLGQLVCRMTAGDSVRRPASAREVANGLEEYVGKARAEGGGAPSEDLARRASRAAAAKTVRVEGVPLRPEASFLSESLTTDSIQRTIASEANETPESGPSGGMSRP